MKWPAELEHFLDDLALLVHLDRIHADVLAGVFVLGNGALKGFVNVLEAMPEDVAEANERREVDAAQLKVIDELLQVDGASRLLGRMDSNLAVLTNREISLAPAVDLVQLGGVDVGPYIAHVVRRARPAKRVIHVIS
jgi:hypothetical protein